MRAAAFIFNEEALRRGEVRGRHGLGAPNPSGLKANYRTEDLARLFRELREAVEHEL
jgi:hypothetical protein